MTANTEDGYAPDQVHKIVNHTKLIIVLSRGELELNELLRFIQFFNYSGSRYHVTQTVKMDIVQGMYIWEVSNFVINIKFDINYLFK